MNHSLYLLRKSTSNIVSRPLSAITALLSLMLLLFLFDLTWISSLSVNRYFEAQEADIDMEIFLDDVLPDSTAAIVLNTIAGMDGVDTAEYISKENAREKLYSMMGTDLLADMEGNPLPRSVVISFDRGYLSGEYLNQFEGNLKALAGVLEIYYPRQWLEKIEYIKALSVKIVIFLGLVICLAVVLNLVSSIRLSAKRREEELIQMRFMGATRIFLATPYIVEGAFYALAAAVAGWVIISYSIGRWNFRDFVVVLPTQAQILYFCLMAMIVGMAGGYAGIRRSL